jgi:hypothetical protein
VFTKSFSRKKLKYKAPGSTGRVLEEAKLQNFSSTSSCTCYICDKTASNQMQKMTKNTLKVSLVNPQKNVKIAKLNYAKTGKITKE